MAESFFRQVDTISGTGIYENIGIIICDFIHKTFPFREESDVTFKSHKMGFALQNSLFTHSFRLFSYVKKCSLIDVNIKKR